MQFSTGKQNSCIKLLLSMKAQLVLHTGGLVLQTWVGINFKKKYVELQFIK